MIVIEGLTKTYPSGRSTVEALKEIDLTLGGGMFGLVGPNGAGKSTLLRLLAGLMTPTRGRIVAFGHDLATDAGRRAHKAALGYLPQELGLYPNLTAAEMLDYMAVLKGIADPALRRRQIAELLALVGLADVSGRKLKTFSGGMKRRVGIAQALLGSPRLLIVDEPTVGLDPEERARLRALLSEVAMHCTVILSTHIIEDIGQSCHDLAVLYRGQVIYRGAPRALIEAARGQVWAVEARNGETPTGDDGAPLTLVAALPMADGGVLHRVVGQPAARYHARPADPTLEEAYIAMMGAAKTGNSAHLNRQP